MTEDNKPRGPWQPGQSGNPLGRPKGIPNKATLEIKDRARRFLESKTYRRSLAKRLKEDRLPPAVEVLLHHYAYGKPKERIELDANATGLSVEVLKRMPEGVLKAFLEAYVNAQKLLGPGEGGE